MHLFIYIGIYRINSKLIYNIILLFVYNKYLFRHNTIMHFVIAPRLKGSFGEGTISNMVKGTAMDLLCREFSQVATMSEVLKENVKRKKEKYSRDL